MATVADAVDMVTAVGNRMDAVETGQTAPANQLTAITQQLAALVAAAGQTHVGGRSPTYVSECHPANRRYFYPTTAA